MRNDEHQKNVAMRARLDEMPVAQASRITELLATANAEADAIAGCPPSLLQDDSRGLSKWLSRTPNAKQDARDAIEPLAQTADAYGGCLMGIFKHFCGRQLCVPVPTTKTTP